MKRYFFTVVLGIFFAVSAVAQEKPFLLGFKFSPGVSWYKPHSSGLERESVGVDFAGGIIADVRLVENYFFETGLFYDFQSGNLTYQTEYNGAAGKLSRDYQVQYVEIPMTLKMCTNRFGKLRFFGLGGFKTSFRIVASANDMWRSQAESKNMKRDATKDFAFLKESLLFGIGTDFFLDKSTHLTLGINYTTSITNVANSSMECFYDGNWEKAKFSNNILELRLGIIF
ncbi:MAG: PorT family protein [Bacteroidales bacterium]|nr:PorT family protein [Bacteroidales bacterium]